MKQTFDLNKMGLSAMSEFEMQEIDGGKWWTIICAITGAIIGLALGGVLGAVSGGILGTMLGTLTDANPFPGIALY